MRLLHYKHRSGGKPCVTFGTRRQLVVCFVLFFVFFFRESFCKPVQQLLRPWECLLVKICPVCPRNVDAVAPLLFVKCGAASTERREKLKLGMALRECMHVEFRHAETPHACTLSQEAFVFRCLLRRLHLGLCMTCVTGACIHCVCFMCLCCRVSRRQKQKKNVTRVSHLRQEQACPLADVTVAFGP